MVVDAAWKKRIQTNFRVVLLSVLLLKEGGSIKRLHQKLLTICPNGFESGSPYEYFTREDAEHAIVYSRRILEVC